MTKIQKKYDSIFYSEFDQLDGYHPWQNIVPDGYVLYPVRKLHRGKVLYFNFPLAIEMGLISDNHPLKMNPELEKKLIDTFSLQIVNEYDEINQKRKNRSFLKTNPYMATRYLQLQHKDKTGRTSGDGRGIWNGVFECKGSTWDVSSRGTGVTCLAPGVVEAGKPLQTGSEDFGYGCGQAEIDELLAAAIAAEVMHLQGYVTERVLCVIDLGQGYGIGVRAAKNLFRPAHLFIYLKQNRWLDLKNAFDFFIQRQVSNKKWKIKSWKNRYEESLFLLSRSFADFASKLEVDYVFAWLDWDGDNVLADAGIIDYGSVRQFGICHDKYRYDDVDRYSTNLREQKAKAKQLIITFCQMIDYIETKNKKNQSQFKHHACVKEFDRYFETKRSERMLYRVGFNTQQRKNILKSEKKIKDFLSLFDKLERSKTQQGVKKVADGINHYPLLNMRKFLNSFPQHLLLQINNKSLNIFWTMEQSLQLASQFCKKNDLEKVKSKLDLIRSLQIQYVKLLELAFKTKSDTVSFQQQLKSFVARALKTNSSQRITGNALIEIVDCLLKNRKSYFKDSDLQNMIDCLILDHLNYPEVSVSPLYKNFYLNKYQLKEHAVFLQLQDVVLKNQEEI